MYAKREKRLVGRIRCASICNFRIGEGGGCGDNSGNSSVLMLLPGMKLGGTLGVVGDESGGVAGDAFEGAMTATTPSRASISRAGVFSGEVAKATDSIGGGLLTRRTKRLCSKPKLLAVGKGGDFGLHVIGADGAVVAADDEGRGV